MSGLEKLKESSKLTETLAQNLKDVQSDIEDYDLSRMLKKVEAEILDLQYNLSIAIRLMEKG